MAHIHSIEWTTNLNFKLITMQHCNRKHIFQRTYLKTILCNGQIIDNFNYFFAFNIRFPKLRKALNDS